MVPAAITIQRNGPKSLFPMAPGGDSLCRHFMRWTLLLNGDGSGGSVLLVLHRFLSWEKDGFVSGTKMKTAFAVEALRDLVCFVDKQADGFRFFE